MYAREDEDSDVKSFFEQVKIRTEEIMGQKSSERHISEVLTHIDLLERTITKSVHGKHSYRRN